MSLLSFLKVGGINFRQPWLIYLPFAFGLFREIGVMSSSKTPNPYSVAFVTVPNDEVAKKISYGLVENKLAACVNIIPGVKSVYVWQGKVNEDNELILKIKTRSILIEKLTEFVKKNHPYDVCEVISIPIENGNSDYLKWIGETVMENNLPDSVTSNS